MIKNKAVFIVALLCLAFSVTNAADIIYVDANSPNDPGTGTSEDPFRRIQDAINHCISGDTVEIRPGVYTGNGNYDLDPLGKSIIIRSSDPNNPEIIARTIIDPSQAGRGFYIWTEEDANCIVWALTIRNASTGTGSDGGGISCYNSNPTIRNCVIKNGHAEGSGGGICLNYSNAAVINCTITDNTADYYGGGIGCNFSSPLIIGCAISGNTAGFEGGGIDSSASEPNILNCIIANNNAPLGGGINCYYPGVANVVNCTIAGNSADNVGGAIHCWTQGSAIIENSIIWANSSPDGTQIGLDNEGTASVTYSDVQYGQTAVYDPCGLLVWGEGNIDIDPYFASFDLDEDLNFWDFHLKSTVGRWDAAAYPAIDLTQNGFIDFQDFATFATVWLQEDEGLAADLDNSGTVDLLDLLIMLNAYLTEQPLGMWVQDDVSSQCIDAGDPNSDWSQEPWPNGKRINMGAFGGTNQASKNGLKADFDVDGFVNFVDFSYLASKWNLQQSCIEDLNGSGNVDIYDFEEFCISWLEQN